MAERRGEAFDLLEVGSRRFDVLSTLSEGAARKPALTEQLDVSRSTVNRAVRELGERHLVEQTDAGHALTPAGRLLVEELDGFLADLSTLAEAGRLLACLPSEVEMSMAFLRDADVYPATPPAPTGALDPLRDALEQTAYCRCLSGSIADDGSVDRFRRRTADEEMSLDIVFDADVLSYLLADRQDALADFVEAGDEVRRTDSIPYSMALCETDDGGECHLVLFDDDGDIAGVIVNDTEPALAWASAAFERYREAATPLDGI